MVRRYLLAGVIGMMIFALTGCGGSGGASPDSPPNLFGMWNLTRIHTGSGNIDTTYSYNDGQSIDFHSDFTATIQRNGDTPLTGPFSYQIQHTDIQEGTLYVVSLPDGTRRAILSQTASNLVMSDFNVPARRVFEYNRIPASEIP